MTDLSAGWEALARGKWDEALTCFRASEDDPEALEGIGIAQWWLDDADATLEARECAYRLYRAGGDRVGAARVASALAWDSLLFGGRRGDEFGRRAASFLERPPHRKGRAGGPARILDLAAR